MLRLRYHDINLAGFGIGAAIIRSTASLVFFLMLLCGSPAQSHTIAVVYDDSRTMDGEGRKSEDDYAHAGYALQLLRSLIPDSDTMVVVPTSNPAVVSPISSGDFSGDIRKLFEQSKKAVNHESLYATIKTALKTLESSRDPDRWLIVITGCVYYSNGPVQVNCRLDNAAIIADVKKISGLRAVLLGVRMSADDADIREYPSFDKRQTHEGTHVLYASSAEELSKKMQDVTVMVTGGVSGNEVRFSDIRGGKAYFESVFPLKRFSVLHQVVKQSEIAAITSASVGGKMLAYTKDLPDSRMTAKDQLQGRVVRVTSAKPGELIPADSLVEIRFAQSVNPSLVSIVPEVALKLQVELIDDIGNVIHPDENNRHVVCADRTFGIVARLIAPPGSVLRELKQVKVSFSYAGETIKLVFDPSTNTYIGRAMVVKGENRTVTRAEYPGYINMVEYGSLLGREHCPRRTVSLVAEQNGRQLSAWSADVRDLCDGKAAPLELYVVADGKKLSPQAIEGWEAVQVSLSGIEVRIKRTHNGQGWELMPQGGFGGPCFTPTGAYPLHVYINPLRIFVNGKSNPVVSDSDQSVQLSLKGKGIGPRDTIRPFNFTLDIIDPGGLNKCWRFYAKVSLVSMIVIWFVGIIIKSRFIRGSMIVVERTGADSDGDRHLLPGTFFERFIVPFWPESRVVDGIQFKASGSSLEILVSKASISHLKDALTFNGRPKRQPVKRDEKINPATRMELQAGDNIALYRYVYPKRVRKRKVRK